MSSNEYNLQSLVPTTSYLLAYSLPLLLVSLLPTFSGAFFTLARTRSFPPQYDSIPGSFGHSKKTRRTAWVLEGGIGGLALGYVFGVHFATFLSLLIPSVTSSARLSKGSFLAVWLISSIVTTILAGRWRYCAFSLVGISGGASLAIALSIITHPSLLTRQVLIGIFIPIALLGSLLPFHRYRLMAIRISASATGAFGMTLSTALLAHIPAWANAWERLWQPHNIQWGTSQEQGLSAMFCLCTIFGSAVDWYLRRRFGECPDEKWDSYLADYTSNLPNRADRAGTFQPLTSFWDRVFSSSSKPSPSREIIFPPTGTPDLKSSGTLDYSLPTLHKEQVVSLPNTPGFLRKSRSKAQKSYTAHNVGAKKRPGIKFKPMDELSSDSEDEGPRRPWLTQKPSTTSTDATLLDDARKAKPDIDVKDLDYDTELAKLQSLGRARDIQKGLIPEYSDNEDDGDLGLKGRSISPLAKQDQDNHTNSAGASSATSHTAVAPLSPTTSAHPHVISFSHSSTGGPGNIPLAPVPATPSLLKALDRVAEAQKQAYGNISPSPPIPHPLGTPPTLGAKNLDGLPTPHQPNAPAVTSPTPQTARSGRWQNFWREVDEKAQQ